MKEFLDELKNIHKRFSKFEFAIVIVFLLIVLVIPGKPELIGFSDVRIHRQDVSIAADHSRSFVISPTEPLALTSFSVSGEVLGTGAVSVYLKDNQGEPIKVFSNEKKGRNLITGFFGEESEIKNTVSSSDPVLEIKDGVTLDGFESADESSSGQFSFVCYDSCNMKNINGNEYELIAYVEPGTTLIINELDYTTRKN